MSVDDARLNASAIWLPPPELTVSQWADQERRLSSEAAAEPGRWSTDKAPYQRGIMDAVNDPDIENIVIKSSAQVGKSEICLNVMGYFVHHDPSPMLMVQPTLQMAETFSKDRLAPMVRDTPALVDKIQDAKSRDSGNTLLKKNFPGGHITLAGSNSPASLASRPIRVLICDEVDKYPASAGSDGDPISLARKRTTTFFNRKIVMVSTPTIKHVSRIDAAYDDSDQRVYKVPCPHCGHKQALKWANVQWPKDAPEKAAYVCSDVVKVDGKEVERGCGTLIEEQCKQQMLMGGEWVAQTTHHNTAGFHVNEIYSPWSTWAKMARDFLAAKDNTEMLKQFVQEYLGECWEDDGEQLEADQLFERREEYSHDVPAGVCVLVAGVDVQEDRIEMEVVGYGAGEASWGIEYRVIFGDLTQPEPWDRLDQALQKVYEHEYGSKIRVVATCVDSGHHTKMVYAFCRGKESRRVFAVKGVAGEGRAIVTAPVKRKTGQQKIPVKLFTVGTDEAKAIITSRHKQTSGRGVCHWPMKYDLEYFKQLTAEKCVTKFKKGFKFKEWIKTRPRNEAFDIRVYAYAALVILNPVFEVIEKSLQPESVASKPEKTPVRRVRSRGGFANSWKQ